MYSQLVHMMLFLHTAGHDPKCQFVCKDNLCADNKGCWLRWESQQERRQSFLLYNTVQYIRKRSSLWLRCAYRVFASRYELITSNWQYITVASLWSRWRLKSPASPLFTQLFIRVQIKESIKAPRHWPLCGEFTGDRWIPGTKGQERGKCFNLMTSSWIYSRMFEV